MLNKNSREYAFFALIEILINEAYSNITLNKLFSQNEINNLDKKHITEIVYGTIKNKLYLEKILKYYSKIKIKNKVKILLIMSIYQLLYMNKTPDFAVVNEAVNIAKKNGGYNTAKFVNAVLRNLIITKNNIVLDFKDDIEKFCIENSCPYELFEILKKQYNLDKAKKIVKSFSFKSENSIRVNTIKTNKDNLIKDFLDININVRSSEICEDCLLIDNIDFNSDLFTNGHFIIQDEASALVACTINKDENAKYEILDVCSAPGGKSLHIATKYKYSNVLSCDKYIHKLNLINQNAKRLNLKNIKTLEQDALKTNSSFVKKFDIVVCDVPCSGIGVIKNKPEIKYKITDDYVKKISKLQYEILENSKNYLKKGGILIYSTCTIDKRENEYNVEKFLEYNKNFKLEKININSVVKEERDGIIKILPDEYNCDGFFIAKLKKVEE